MRKNYIVWFAILSFLGGMMNSSAQICDPTVPVFTVDLTGNPNGTWTSPSVTRSGLCCVASGGDKCVEFIITLDSAAVGISFNIISGAIPGGALYYQVDCGAPSALGAPVCLNGVGPHYLTFCKPGNNNNEYQIQSFPQPSAGGSEYVSQACTGFLSAQGLDDTSITWTSIPFNSNYNSFLSCTRGCDSVIVTPTGIAPPFVDYQVCGNVTGACGMVSYCDTIRINFVNTLDVTIAPQNPTICFGGANASVSAIPSGGLAPYNFLWSNGATTQSITVGAGTYVVEITDSMSCSIQYDTVIVNALPSVIAANAGPDQLLCYGSSQSIVLNGSVVAATGGIWMNGTGTFVPDNTDLNATYSPSVSEINSGSINLMFVTTGNSGCPADTDYFELSIAPQPSPNISGIVNMCQYSEQSYIAVDPNSFFYSWSVNGGTIINNFGDTITVRWDLAGTDNVTLTASNVAGCDTVLQLPITVYPQPVPVLTGAVAACTPMSSVYYVSNVMNDSVTWAVSGGMISGSANADSVLVQWNSTGPATVTVTETNSLGCDSSLTLAVSLSSTPITFISGLQNICGTIVGTYTAASSNAIAHNWSVIGGSIVNNNGASIDVLWNTIGTGSITLTATNASGCDTTITYPVNIFPQPAPVISGSILVCTPSTSIYRVVSPGANSFNWVVNGGIIAGTSNVDSIMVLWNSPGTGVVTLTELNSNGCDSTVSMNVNLSSTPVTSINGPQNICGLQNANYFAAPSTATTFNWTVNGGSIAQNNGDSIQVSWTSSGAASVSLTAINAQGCDTTIIYPVNLNPAPAPVLSGPITLCLPASSVYHVSSPGINNFAWTITEGTILGSASADSISVQWNNITGIGIVSVTAVNAYGCDSTITLSVALSVTPSPVLTGQQTFCGPQAAIYFSSPSNALNYNWTVYGGIILNNNGDNIIVQWDSSITGSIVLTAMNAEGCDTTMNYFVDVYPQPSPVVTGAMIACVPSTLNYSLSPATNDTYNWIVTGGTINGNPDADSVSVYWNSSGTGTVSLTQTNAYGCDTTIVTYVSLSSYPAPIIGGIDFLCKEDTASYSVPQVQGHTYDWSVTGGAIIGFTVSNSIDVYWYNQGAGNVRVIQTSAEGCATPDSKTVEVNTPPTPSISGMIVNCLNDETNYQSIQHVGSNYEWSVNGGTIIGSTTQNPVIVQWPSAGQATVTVTETDMNGCSASVPLQVLVNQLPVANINGSQEGCVNQYGSLYSATILDNVQYHWSVNGGVVTGNNGYSNVNVLWNSTGISQVNLLTLNTSTGCHVTTSLQVRIDSMQQPQITANDFNGCSPLITRLGTSPSVTSYNYQWSFGDGASSQDIVTTHTYISPGNYIVTLIVNNNTGCKDTVRTNVVVFNSPVADFLINTSDEFYPADETSFTLQNISAGGIHYLWSFGGGITSTDFEPSYQYTAPGTYQIMLVTTNMYGCRDSMLTSLEIKVPESIYVPNAFTPNGDSRNDGFAVTSRNITELHISIFNRWGEEVYVSNDKDFMWDGSYYDHGVQEGVYVYKLSAIGYHGQQFNRTGTVSVLK
ncbi:hypothetical protein BH11BAC1_BH11BAC1_16540 [soil metagenome]